MHAGRPLDQKWPAAAYMDSKWLAEDFEPWILPKGLRDARYYYYDVWDKERKLAKFHAAERYRWAANRHVGRRHSKRTRARRQETQQTESVG
jgi:hypothetical protein